MIACPSLYGGQVVSAGLCSDSLIDIRSCLSDTPALSPLCVSSQCLGGRTRFGYTPSGSGLSISRPNGVHLTVSYLPVPADGGPTMFHHREGDEACLI